MQSPGYAGGSLYHHAPANWVLRATGKHMWIFWVGPIVGAMLAVGLYKFMNANANANVNAPSESKETKLTEVEEDEAED